jgi:hypothetical protein
MNLFNKFVPLLDKFWQTRGRTFFGVETWNIRPEPLAKLWLDRNLLIVLAQDGEKAVGFLMGLYIQPFFMNEGSFTVEAWHGETPEVEAGLIKYVKDAFAFSSEKYLIMPVYDGKVPYMEGNLKEVVERRVRVFRR